MINKIKIYSQFSPVGSVLTTPVFLRLGVHFEILNRSPKTNKEKHEKEAVGRKGIYHFFFMATLPVHRELYSFSNW